MWNLAIRTASPTSDGSPQMLSKNTQRKRAPRGTGQRTRTGCLTCKYVRPAAWADSNG